MTSTEDKKARRELSAQPGKNPMGGERFVIIERRVIPPAVPGAQPVVVEVGKKHCVF